MSCAKSIVHMHVGYGDWQSRQTKWALRQADGLVGVSRFVARTIVDAGYRPQRVHSVVNCLDLSSGKWDPTIDGGPTRAALGIPAGAPVLGISSRLYVYKGHSALLDALALVKQDVPDVRLVIVGEDDPRAHPGGGSFRSELEAQTRRLGLESNVIFTGFRTDIPQLLAAFDVYAMPTWEEPCAIAFLEAMAMGKPVVAWHSGGTPELVVHNQTGLLVEPNSPPALAGALLSLVRDPALRRRFGEAGRQRVEQTLTPARMCSEMVEVYRAVIGAPRHHPTGSTASLPHSA